VTSASPVLAAGALCWRLVDGKARILVVHRGDRADVSLPKGKVDPGETLPQTAVREIAEETGLEISLGAPLGTVEYTLPSGRDKVVYYWAAEIDHHALEIARFVPGNEIAALEWLPIDKARKKLTYEHDVEVLDRFEKRLKKGNARTFAIIVVRHGKAVPPETWDGPDATRPLLQRGADQSVAIAKGIAAFAPRKILSSNAVRCLATVEPLSRLTQVDVKASAAISQDAYDDDTEKVRAIVAKRVKRKETVVLCSHGPVIPQLLDELAAITSAKPTTQLHQASLLSTGEFAVVHLSCEHPRKGIVATELHGPNLT
jgi:8-oxo-dGTP diphosphatase